MRKNPLTRSYSRVYDKAPPPREVIGQALRALYFHIKSIATLESLFQIALDFWCYFKASCANHQCGAFWRRSAFSLPCRCRYQQHDLSFASGPLLSMVCSLSYVFSKGLPLKRQCKYKAVRARALSAANQVSI